MGGVRTLVVWCPDWPVVAAGHSATEPVAVVAANRVVACSEAARQEGVSVGLRRREAQGRCSEVVVIEQDSGRDARAFEPVVAAVEAFTPSVEVGPPGMVSFGTRGPSRYFGGDRSLAAQVATAVNTVLAPLGAPVCRVGVADGPFAAEQAARVAEPRRSELVARPGSLEPGSAILCPLSVAQQHPVGTETLVGAEGARRGKGPGPGLAAGGRAAGPAVLAPGGLAAGGPAVLLVPPGRSGDFLASFPVQALGRPDLADLLIRLGLPTLGDLAALPAKTVLARFGPDGALAHRLARGRDERSLASRTPPPDLAVAAELDPPAERVDMAMFVAKSLADQLHELLADRGLACTRVAIEAETEHGEHLIRLWRHDGALTSRAIAERVRWQLDGWLSTGATTAGVTLLRLIPDEVKPDHGRQLGFWGGSAAADDRAARGFARIQGLLGPEGVVTAVVGGGRDPGVQVQLIPWGDPRPAPTPTPRSTPTRSAPPDPHLAPPDPPSVPRPDPPSAPRTDPPPARSIPTPREVPPWPGHLPPPAPALVHPDRLPAELHDGAGQSVMVTGRGVLGSAPAALSIAGQPPLEVVAWAGPWPAEERWWDQQSSRRRARFQVCGADGAAHVIALESGHWWVEGTYD